MTKTIIAPGPRNKNESTIEFENLVKNLLLTKSQNETAHVSYQRGHMIVSLADKDYDLTALLEEGVDWEQLDLNDDLKLYEDFLKRPETNYKHILQNLKNTEEGEVDLGAVKHQYPHLTEGELSAIRIYTSVFYTAINHLLRSNGQEEFPLNPSNMQFKLALYKFRQDNGYNLNQLVTELLLHSSFAAFALSKPIQDQISLYFAASVPALEAQLPHFVGRGLVIIGQDDLRSVVLVEFGKIQNVAEMLSLDLKKLHFQIQHSEIDLWKFNQDELDELNECLDNPSQFSALPPALTARFLAYLNNLINSDGQNLYMGSTLYRGDTVNPFMQSLVQEVMENEGGVDQKLSGFYSTSQKEDVVRNFLKGKPGFITKVRSHAHRDISILSQIPSECESLFPPGQQLHYIHSQEMPDKNTLITAETVRGIELTIEEEPPQVQAQEAAAIPEEAVPVVIPEQAIPEAMPVQAVPEDAQAAPPLVAPRASSWVSLFSLFSKSRPSDSECNSEFTRLIYLSKDNS